MSKPGEFFLMEALERMAHNSGDLLSLDRAQRVVNDNANVARATLGRIRALEGQVQELKSLLRSHGEHRVCGVFDGGPCDCGLDNAIGSEGGI